MWYLTVKNVYICPFSICSDSLLGLPFSTYLKGTLPREAKRYLRCISDTENLKSCDEGLLLFYPFFKGMHTSNGLHYNPGPSHIAPVPLCSIQQLNYWRSSSLNFLFNISEDVLGKSILLNKSQDYGESFILLFLKCIDFPKIEDEEL